MCLIKENPEVVNKQKSPVRSPWRRILRQNVRPKLNRKVVNSAKINLNNFWSDFKNLSTRSQPIMMFQPTTTTANNRSFAMSINDNEINDNLLNELTELIGK